MTLVILHKFVLTQYEGVEKPGKARGEQEARKSQGRPGGGEAGELEAHQAPELPVSQRVPATLFLRVVS